MRDNAKQLIAIQFGFFLMSLQMCEKILFSACKTAETCHLIPIDFKNPSCLARTKSASRVLFKERLIARARALTKCQITAIFWSSNDVTNFFHIEESDLEAR